MQIKRNNGLILIMAVLLATAAFYSNCRAETKTIVNLILDGRTVLIYHGKEAGFEKGQQLNVVRNGKVVGSLKVTEVAAAYVQAEITTSPDAIMEGDEVMAAGGAAAKASPAKAEKKADTKSAAGRSSGRSARGGAKAASAEDKPEAKTSARSSSRRSRSSSRSAAADAGGSDSGGSSRARSSRSRRGGSSADSSDDDSSASSSRSRRSRRGASSSDDDDSGASSSRSRRGGRSSRSSSGGGDDDEEEKDEPKVLGPTPHYSLHFGYFYLDSDDLPGSVVSESPEPVVSLDYWIPKRDNMNIYYSLLYSRPKVETSYGNQRVAYQMRMIQFMGGLVWSDLDTSMGGDIYGGFAAGWRSASYEINCSITCDGIEGVEKKSMEGMDYHGILGINFRKKSELKFLYSFDEQYYTIDYGIRY